MGDLLPRRRAPRILVVDDQASIAGLMSQLLTIRTELRLLDHETVLERMESALAKCTELMERHLAAGELTVPARALYFILRDAGFGTAHTQTHEVKQAPKEQLEAAVKKVGVMAKDVERELKAA